MANDTMQQPKQTIQQARAKHALNAVQSWKKKEAEAQKKLKSYSSDFPAMILINGLGQAIAFAKMKGEGSSTKEYKDLYNTLQDWLTSNNLKQATQQSELINIITSVDMQTYQLLQTESLMYLDWIKKFSKAFLVEKEA